MNHPTVKCQLSDVDIYLLKSMWNWCNLGENQRNVNFESCDFSSYTKKSILFSATWYYVLHRMLNTTARYNLQEHPVHNSFTTAIPAWRSHSATPVTTCRWKV